MMSLKSLFTVLLLPLTVILGLLIIGVAILTFSDKQIVGRVIIIIAVIYYVAISFELVPSLLLRPLEYRYPSLCEYTPVALIEKYPDIKWIIVLSGGHTTSPEVPLSLQGTRVSTVRLVEGIRLLRIYPQAKLLLSGGEYSGQICDADAMAAMAKDLGVSDQSIVLERESTDTQNQARMIQHIVGSDGSILVTSAAHVVRALGFFNKLGMHPIPAPTDYLVKTREITDRFYYPNEESMLKFRTAFHEYFGILWGKMTGKI